MDKQADSNELPSQTLTHSPATPSTTTTTTTIVNVKVLSGERAGEQQHLVIQPIEFDSRHRNMYGYLALAAFILVLINYIMIKERTCQISIVNGAGYYDLLQSFHLTTLIVAIIIFILSYFNFAMVIYEFKLIFYTTAALIFVCAGLLIYNAVAIVSAPCVTLNSPFVGNGLLSVLDVSAIGPNGATNVFSAGDGVGITVFFFDIIAAVLLFFTGRRFYIKS